MQAIPSTSTAPDAPVSPPPTGAGSAAAAATPYGQLPPRKLGGYEFYREVLGSAKYVVAPMVDQSELAFRRLCRNYGADVVYTPMINAKMFTDSINKTYRSSAFDIGSGEEGAYAAPPPPSTSSLDDDMSEDNVSKSAADVTSIKSTTASPAAPPTSYDRPLIVQFCANDPDKLLESALVVQPYCDAVDINLGCPQDIAKRGHYGSFLQDEWELIEKMISTLHKNLAVPVTAKFRVFPSIEKTVEYAQMLERAGAQILTCHGRLREQRGQNTGLASYAHIRAVKQAVKVPVFANGNMLFREDVLRCLEETGCDGVMSAEGVLYNPALFHGLKAESEGAPPLPFTAIYPPHTRLAREYLDLVASQTTKTPVSAVKGHLFKIMRPALARETDLRARLGKVGFKGGEGGKEGARRWMEEAYAIVEEMRVRMERDATAAAAAAGEEEAPIEESLVTICEKTGLRVMPHWLAQPYFRPLPEKCEVADVVLKPVGPKPQKKKKNKEDAVTVARVGGGDDGQTREVSSLSQKRKAEEEAVGVGEEKQQQEVGEGVGTLAEVGDGCGVGSVGCQVVGGGGTGGEVKRRKLSVEGEVAGRTLGVSRSSA